jgi:hypothetical protein
MAIKKQMPQDYNGQPRSENGQFSRGKQNGSRSRGRNVGTQQVAGLGSLPPIKAPKPGRRPGERPPSQGV